MGDVDGQDALTVNNKNTNNFKMFIDFMSPPSRLLAQMQLYNHLCGYLVGSLPFHLVSFQGPDVLRGRGCACFFSPFILVSASDRSDRGCISELKN